MHVLRVLCVLHSAWGVLLAGSCWVAAQFLAVREIPINMRTHNLPCFKKSIYVSNWLFPVGCSKCRMSFFPPCLCIAPRTRPHTCTRSQRKRRNISTETATYVKTVNIGSVQDKLVRNPLLPVSPSLPRSGFLPSQRNGYDRDSYSAISSRVSG